MAGDGRGCSCNKRVTFPLGLPTCTCTEAIVYAAAFATRVGIGLTRRQNSSQFRPGRGTASPSRSTTMRGPFPAKRTVCRTPGVTI